MRGPEGVSEVLWKRVQGLFPTPVGPSKGGRPQVVSDRQALAGILFVLQHGIPWEHLPQTLGCGSGMTCWRRLRHWQETGLWQRLHRMLLAEPGVAESLDFSRAMVSRGKRRMDPSHPSLMAAE